MRHPHGTFCWMDIYLPDPEKGKAFYNGLFGWEWTDVPMGGTEMSYTMFNLDGKSVGAMGPSMPGMYPEGVPPCWLSYMATDGIDATVSPRCRQRPGGPDAGPLRRFPVLVASH